MSVVFLYVGTCTIFCPPTSAEEKLWQLMASRAEAPVGVTRAISCGSGLGDDQAIKPIPPPLLLLADFVVEMIETLISLYMADDEEAEWTMDGAVRKDRISWPKFFFRLLDDRYVLAEAATVAGRDLLMGEKKRGWGWGWKREHILRFCALAIMEHAKSNKFVRVFMLSLCGERDASAVRYAHLLRRVSER